MCPLRGPGPAPRQWFGLSSLPGRTPDPHKRFEGVSPLSVLVTSVGPTYSDSGLCNCGFGTQSRPHLCRDGISRPQDPPLTRPQGPVVTFRTLGTGSLHTRSHERLLPAPFSLSKTVAPESLPKDIPYTCLPSETGRHVQVVVSEEMGTFSVTRSGPRSDLLSSESLPVTVGVIQDDVGLGDGRRERKDSV